MHEKIGKLSDEDIMEEIALISSLKFCAKKKNVYTGISIHADILRNGLLDRSPCVASALIRMYAKCGRIERGQETHDELPNRSLMSWNALITGHVQQEQDLEALNDFGKMLRESFYPDATTFIFILKACGNVRAIMKAKQIHCAVIYRGMLKKDIMLSTALIDMYAKCGLLEEGQQVHNTCVRDVVSWSTLISGFVRRGDGHGALQCYVQMQHEGFSPDVVTFSCMLKACITILDFEKGKQIHNEIVLRGFQNHINNVVLGNSLIDMYAKCGAFAEAQKVHKELPVQNGVCWSSLIAAHVHAGQGDKALHSFEQMQQEGHVPDVVTYTCILRACGSSKAIGKGTQIHHEIVGNGWFGKNVLLGNALVDMYGKCGEFAKAHEVLEELPHQDVFSWSLLIASYSNQGRFHEAIYCFEQMQSAGLAPDEVTLSCILKACGNGGNIYKGREIHDTIIKQEYLDRNIILGNALLDMYAECGELVKAQEVLEALPVRNEISWTTLIAGYVQQGRCHEALNCFEQMKTEGIAPNAVTFVYALKSCGQTGAISKGEQIHNDIFSKDLLNKDVVLASALIEMYVKCSLVVKAQQVHDDLCIRNVFSWNALIAGYMQEGKVHNVLNCFEMIENDGLSADAVTFTAMLKAYGSRGAIDWGRRIHHEVVQRGLERNFMLATALMGLYIKCGLLAKAARLHNELCVQDIVSWNALIAGYAQQGQVQNALNNFACLQRENQVPDAVTFSCILHACSHSGLWNEAQTYFGDMTRIYGIIPNIEHYSCMVATLSCTGIFDKAVSMIKAVLCSNNVVVWLALLNSCKKWGNVTLGKFAFDQVVLLDKSCAAAYVLMIDIYSAASMEGNIENIQITRQKEFIEET